MLKTVFAILFLFAATTYN